MNSRSRSSTSAVISLALSASGRARTKLRTPPTPAPHPPPTPLPSLPRVRLGIGLHDLERVQRTAEARFGVGDDGHEPVDLGAAFRMLDLVGALEGAVDTAAELGAGIGRIEALVRIHRARGVGVGRDLP